MTDNRTNEPTEAQVEAAARAIWERYAGHGLWETLPPARKAPFLKDARAALVAAQGAAPQAERPGRQELGQTIRNKFNEARGRSGVDPWALADLILEEHPALAAPVLPSSGVDEEKLAEVIARSRGFGNGWEQIPPLTRGAYREVARAVAEWLKEQGR